MISDSSLTITRSNSKLETKQKHIHIKNIDNNLEFSIINSDDRSFKTDQKKRSPYVIGYFNKDKLNPDFPMIHKPSKQKNNQRKIFIIFGIIITLIIIISLLAVILWIRNKKQISDEKSNDVNSYTSESWECHILRKILLQMILKKVIFM